MAPITTLRAGRPVPPRRTQTEAHVVTFDHIHTCFHCTTPAENTGATKASELNATWSKQSRPSLQKIPKATLINQTQTKGETAAK